MDALDAEFAKHDDRVEVTCGRNVEAASSADVIILSFPPNQAQRVLSEHGMRDAVRDKPIIGILAGVSKSDIEQYLSGQTENLQHRPLHTSSRQYQLSGSERVSLQRCSLRTSLHFLHT